MCVRLWVSWLSVCGCAWLCLFGCVSVCVNCGFVCAFDKLSQLISVSIALKHKARRTHSHTHSR